MDFIKAHKKIFITLSAVAIFALGFSGGKIINKIILKSCHDKHDLINSDIVCGKDLVIKKHGYIETQERINNLFEEKKQEGKLSEAGVYFRDLNSGPVMGINETTAFAPASLLKLPLALVYLTIGEREPIILDKKLSFAKSVLNTPQTLNEQVAILPNTEYSVEELLMRMLAYSDNNAYALLQDYLEISGRTNMIRDTYLELGIIATNNSADEIISVRRYASLFRLLYNNSYLNPELSEKVLTWLSMSDYKKGLSSGVPQDIRIAHKFGERFSETNEKQLHDCGIVYYPENPYMLCVMTVGGEFEDLEEIIGSVSRIVYEEVDSRKM